MTNAIFVIRGQPLHKGHVSVIRNLIKKYNLIIALGSVDKKDGKNPFSYLQRRKMLTSIFGKNKFRIIGIEDDRSDIVWRKNIEKKVNFDIVVTGNEWVKKCFSEYEIIEPKFLKPKIYTSSKIRELMKSKKKWDHLVPKEILKIIK